MRPVAPLLVATALVLAACGGNDEMMSRQEFVDSLGEQGDGLINDNIASCMYDGLSDDPEAAAAVQDWEDGESVPPELIDLATECLTNPGETPGS
jgi:hypothetical protein